MAGRAEAGGCGGSPITEPLRGLLLSGESDVTELNQFFFDASTGGVAGLAGTAAAAALFSASFLAFSDALSASFFAFSSSSFFFLAAASSCAAGR